MKKLAAAVLVALVGGVFVVGQTLAQDVEEKKGGGAAPQMPAWMAKTPIHEGLAKTVGTFDVIAEFWMAPGAPPQKNNGVAKREMILNGMYLRENYTMPMGAGQYEGQLTLGYDTVRKKYVSTWISNGSPVLSVSYGVEKDGVLHFTGEDPDFMSGGLVKNRSEIKLDSNDKWVWTHYMLRPEGEQIQMRLTYTRRKEEAK
jgi:hypothetical protein